MICQVPYAPQGALRINGKRKSLKSENYKTFCILVKTTLTETHLIFAWFLFLNLSPPTVQPVKNTIALQPQIELSEAEPPHKLLYVPEAIKAAAVLYLPSSGCAAMARQRRAARAASVGQSVSQSARWAPPPAAPRRTGHARQGKRLERRGAGGRMARVRCRMSEETRASPLTFSPSKTSVG